MSRRFSGDMLQSSHAKKASDWIFKWSGLNLWNEMAQEAFFDVLSQHIGEQAALARNPEAVIDPLFLASLRKFGIDETSFREMAKHAATDRLSADMLPANLHIEATKLRQYMDNGVNEAILMPTDSDMALTHFGTQSGTWVGEAARTVSMYRGLQVALSRTVYRRLTNAIREEAVTSWSKRLLAPSSIHAYTFLASALAIGWVAFSMKEISKGREPIHFLTEDQRNGENFVRWLASSGLMGLTHDVLSLDSGALFGPVAGYAMDVVSEDSFYGFMTKATGAIPGATLPFVNEGRKELLSWILGDAAVLERDMNVQSLERFTGQHNFLYGN
jgi:hypothetical protein